MFFIFDSYQKTTYSKIYPHADTFSNVGACPNVSVESKYNMKNTIVHKQFNDHAQTAEILFHEMPTIHLTIIYAIRSDFYKYIN